MLSPSKSDNVPADRNPFFSDELRPKKDHLARDIDAYENIWEGRCRHLEEGF
jgi:hypothetical protein